MEGRDAETKDPSRRRQALQEDRLGTVQEIQGVQEPHPDQEGAGPETRSRSRDFRLRLRPQAGPGDVAVCLTGRKTENGKRKTNDGEKATKTDSRETEGLVSRLPFPVSRLQEVRRCHASNGDPNERTAGRRPWLWPRATTARNPSRTGWRSSRSRSRSSMP